MDRFGPQKTKQAQQSTMHTYSGSHAANTNSPASSAHALALNWLEGHSRILHFWLERLVSENGDMHLIETLHDQDTWLRERLATLDQT